MILWSWFCHLVQGLRVWVGAGAVVLVGVIAIAGIVLVHSGLFPWACAELQQSVIVGLVSLGNVLGTAVIWNSGCVGGVCRCAWHSHSCLVCNFCGTWF